MAGNSFRNLNLNDKITVELTVGEALMATSEYTGAEWSSPAATNLFYKIQLELFDPVYVKEQEAAAQAQRDAGQHWMNLAYGRDPDLPPNMEE